MNCRYRLIAGDKCTVDGGLNLLPKKVACTSSGTSSTSNGFYLLFIFLDFVGNVSSDQVTHHKVAIGIVVLIVFLIIGVIAAIIGGLFYLNRKNRFSFFLKLNLFTNIRNLQFRPLGGYDDSGTALDEDLLQSKDAEPIDEEEIVKNLNAPK